MTPKEINFLSKIYKVSIIEFCIKVNNSREQAIKQEIKKC
jgi:hypothetical protein